MSGRKSAAPMEDKGPGHIVPGDAEDGAPKKKRGRLLPIIAAIVILPLALGGLAFPVSSDCPLFRMPGRRKKPPWSRSSSSRCRS
jgi:hypothetical protein